MRWIYNPLKAAQAAAHLLQLHHGSMNVMVLVKLLYLADRQALVESGYPITCAAMVSMPHGPVLSQIYDAIKLCCSISPSIIQVEGMKPALSPRTTIRPCSIPL